MDFVISFFRDVLDGPLYIAVAITCGILICSCIGYLGEQYLNKQKEKKEFESTHASVAGAVADTNVSNSQVGVATTSLVSSITDTNGNQGQ